MARVLLGVSGGIAAYKACEVCRLLVKGGHEVVPLVTPAAERFVTAETFRALARRPPPAAPRPGAPRPVVGRARRPASRPAPCRGLRWPETSQISAPVMLEKNSGRIRPGWWGQ